VHEWIAVIVRRRTAEQQRLAADVAATGRGHFRADLHRRELAGLLPKAVDLWAEFHSGDGAGARRR
jgi:hypothetical protein